jgi:hypothetical protein
MGMIHLKRAKQAPDEATAALRGIVEAMLADIAAGGEQAVREHAARPQLPILPGLRMPYRPPEEEFVQSSIRSAVAGLDNVGFNAFLEGCRARGVCLKWFGARQAAGYPSASARWGFLREPHTPPTTAAVLEWLCDTQIPLTLTKAECGTIARLLGEELSTARPG